MNQKVSLFGVYTPEEIELIGDRLSLQWLSEQLLSKKFIYDLSPPGEISVEPPSNLLTAFRSSTERNGPVFIKLHGSVLEVSGSLAYMSILSQDIKFLANQTEADDLPAIEPHIHIEYFPDHPYLAYSSLPLVITLNVK